MLQNAKKKKFSGLFSIAILQISPSCVTSYQDALISFALLFRFDKKLFYLFLRLFLCLCVVVQLFVSTQHSIGCLVWFPGMM